MTLSDWPAVEEIYRQGIEDGEATFETRTPTWEAFDAAGSAAHVWSPSARAGDCRHGRPHHQSRRAPRTGV